MCGICGVIRPTGTADRDSAVVDEVNRRQHHRGPDDSVRWRDDQVVLGQTRLAIIDLTDGGRQPFHTPDGSVSVVFNGELYNHEALRQRYGLTTRDRCDGAVLPELWQRLGTVMFGELRGMYAIGVYDRRDGTVTLARDPFGIKPLYWNRTATGALAFASEPRSLLPLVQRPRLAQPALAHYLTFGALGPDQSPFAGIEAVPANGWLQWDRGCVARREGTVRAAPFDELPATGPSQLRDGFVASVAAHLRSDVPLALLLSSGLDSAAIAWACAALGTQLSCVTVDLGAGPSELSGARRVADRFGHSHDVVSAVPDESLVERYFAAMQRPSIDGLNVFVVSRAIAELGVKVALSGLGGDEVLAGYPVFRLLRWLPWLRAADAVALTPLLAAAYRGRNDKVAQLLGASGPRDAADLNTLVRRVLTDDQVAALLPGGSAACPDRAAHRLGVVGARDTSARALVLAELGGYLGGTLLPDTDAFSMAWSVEARVPYVDVPFARAALAMAPRRGVGKRRFAAALGDAELRRIARRPKRGFELPMDAWMRVGPLRDRVRQAFHPDAPVRALLRPDAVDDLLTGWQQGRLSWSRAWLMVSLDAWLRTLGHDLAAASPADDRAAASPADDRAAASPAVTTPDLAAAGPTVDLTAAGPTGLSPTDALGGLR